MSRIGLGPRCRRCSSNEASCARSGGCCPDCSHTFGEPTFDPIEIREVDPAVRQMRVARLAKAEACLPPDLIAAAGRLVAAVRSRDPGQVNGALSDVNVRHVAICLAAMVPAESSPADLLAWNDMRHKSPEQRFRALLPHGTHSAFNRHAQASETPCSLCVEGERRYQQARYARRRAKSAPVVPAMDNGEVA